MPIEKYSEKVKEKNVGQGPIGSYFCRWGDPLEKNILRDFLSLRSWAWDTGPSDLDSTQSHVHFRSHLCLRMTWLPQSQDLRIPANLTFPSIWSPLSSSKWVNNLCISLVEVNQASIVFENDLAAGVSGYQAPTKGNPDWGFPHIFLFNFFEIFFDRHLGIWREQPCGQTRGRSKSCASCGAIPKSVSKKRVFYRLGKQTDWGPHSNGKFENSFDRLGFWWNLAQGFLGNSRLSERLVFGLFQRSKNREKWRYFAF